jgi:pyruvate,water dikinase
MLTLEFNDPKCSETKLVGGKAASLAQMTAQGLPVAPGFAVTADSYHRYLAEAGLQAHIDKVLSDLGSNPGQSQFDEAERLIGEQLLQVPLPEDVTSAISAAYAKLSAECQVPDVAVAVRSSATAEDSVDASFAGEFETWVDIVGVKDVIAHVHKCYVSVFTGRVLSYLAEKKMHPQQLEMAVVIQKTVRARAAGVMFTLSPTSGDRSRIVLEASWGLGLSVVGGEVTPDRYMLEKISLEVVLRETGHKHIEYRRGDAPQPVPADRQDVLCLSDEEVVELAKFGKRLETIHGSAQDIEFAIDEELPEGKNLVLLQCRPETVWSNIERKPAFDTGASMMSWITASISGGPGSVPTDTHTH